MSDKPSYLGLLNAITLGEGEVECYLNAWASVTRDDGVRQVISTVALREGEHSKAFAKRMCELGYNVLPRDGGDAESKMTIACSTTLSDREKFERLGLGRNAPANGEGDIFSRMFNDTTIDIQTGALLGRYIAEERDSGRMLAGCYAELCRRENGSSSSAALGGSLSPSVVAGLEERLCRIEEMLDRLVAKRAAKN